MIVGVVLLIVGISMFLLTNDQQEIRNIIYDENGNLFPAIPAKYPIDIPDFKSSMGLEEYGHYRILNNISIVIATIGAVIIYIVYIEKNKNKKKI